MPLSKRSLPAFPFKQSVFHDFQAILSLFHLHIDEGLFVNSFVNGPSTNKEIRRGMREVCSVHQQVYTWV